MKAEKFAEIIGTDFFTGVPDSQLKGLCDYLMDVYGIDKHHHIIAANEGNCTAIAAGYHLATGKVPAVYMQNSGEGNIINPSASLLSDKVYGIPCLFIVGWRGEPGVHDEPQHIFQGEITVKLLEDMDIASFIIGMDTGEGELAAAMDGFRKIFAAGKCAALVVRKGAIVYDKKVEYFNSNAMKREDIIRKITEHTGDDPVISTTGKASRELFEIREAKGQGHSCDFLTVGSMGHSSSIAFGAAVSCPGKRFWCIDGDGAALMHMGAMAVIGSFRPENMVHIVINNSAHETVGGMPTVAGGMDLTAIALACGYPYAARVSCPEELDRELAAAKERKALSFIEVMCSIGSRADLGRPTTSAMENKKGFMERLRAK